MKLGWYINRLRSMGPAEIAHRVAEAVRKRRSRGRHEGWARYEPGPLPSLPWLREAILKADPGSNTSTIAMFLRCSSV